MLQQEKSGDRYSVFVCQATRVFLLEPPALAHALPLFPQQRNNEQPDEDWKNVEGFPHVIREDVDGLELDAAILALRRGWGGRRSFVGAAYV